MSFKQAQEQLKMAADRIEELVDIFNGFDDKLNDLKSVINQVVLSQKEPQVSSVGTECSSRLNGAGKVVGETLYWARPRIDVHTDEFYREIYQWCVETYNPATWTGDRSLQIYYFNRVEDRDWFMLKWA